MIRVRKRLIELRLRKGLSQAEAAKRIGISQSMLAMIESGERHGSDDTKVKIATFYKKSVGSLFFTKKITKRD